MGPRASVPVPAGAQTIDGAGKFVTPGFIDTNVHLSLYGGMNDRYETMVRYHDRQPEIVLEAAQTQLKYGITTVRDSYGVLLPLIAVRDRIAAGGAIGPRILVAGNIVGWGGPYSICFSLTRAAGLTLFQEQMNDVIAQGAGEELMAMTPEELRSGDRRLSRQGSGLHQVRRHEPLSEPAFIGFSAEAQRTIVERTHTRRRWPRRTRRAPKGCGWRSRPASTASSIPRWWTAWRYPTTSCV